MIEEIWKDIPGYNGKYIISNVGRIKSYKRYLEGIILVPNIANNGYYKYTLSKDGKTKNFSLHRLLALAFIPNPDNLSQINHKNGIKTDNRLENLEWCSSSQNTLHAHKNKLKINPKGSDCSWAILNEDDVKLIRKLKKTGVRSVDMAKMFNVSETTIGHVIKNRTWRHVL